MKAKIAEIRANIDYTFLKKPIIMRGLAMEYYGLRKRGLNFDFIISNDDYLT